MYCSHCGAQAEGNFCSYCGKPLGQSEEAVVALVSDWTNELRYDVLVRIPEVRSKISAYASHNEGRVTGEEFLKVCDLASSPLAGVSLSTVVAAVYPIFVKLGMQTGKRRLEHAPALPGETLVAVLCSLARRSRSLRQVHQAEDGCVLEAIMPSDIWSVEGDLVVAVRRDSVGTVVEAATKIKGQLFDWGDSNRCLDDHFSDVKEITGEDRP